MKNHFYIYSETKQGNDGPYSIDQLTHAADEGSLVESDQIWICNEQRWIRADLLPGLFTLESIAPSSAPEEPDVPKVKKRDRSNDRKSGTTFKKTKTREFLESVYGKDAEKQSLFELIFMFIWVSACMVAVLGGAIYGISQLNFVQSAVSKVSLIFNSPVTEFEDRIQNSTVVLEEIITANINYRADSFSISHNIVKIPLSETKLYTATANVEYQYGTGGDSKYTDIIKFLYVKDVGWLVTGTNENPNAVLTAILEKFSEQQISYDKIDKQISQKKESYIQVVEKITQELKQMGITSTDVDGYQKFKESDVFQTLFPQARLAARKSYSFQHYSAWVDYLVISNQITRAVANDRLTEWVEEKAEQEFQSAYYSL